MRGKKLGLSIPQGGGTGPVHHNIKKKNIQTKIQVCVRNPFIPVSKGCCHICMSCELKKRVRGGLASINYACTNGSNV